MKSKQVKQIDKTKEKYNLDVSIIILNDKKYTLNESDINERFKKRH